MRSLALFSVLFSTACGSTVGCDFREGSLNGPEDRCQEQVGTKISTTSHGSACEVAGGQVLDEACPRDGAVGECELQTLVDGTRTWDIFYAPTTVEDAESSCDEGTFVAL